MPTNIWHGLYGLSFFCIVRFEHEAQYDPAREGRIMTFVIME